MHLPQIRARAETALEAAAEDQRVAIVAIDLIESALEGVEHPRADFIEGIGLEGQFVDPVLKAKIDHAA